MDAMKYALRCLLFTASLALVHCKGGSGGASPPGSNDIAIIDFFPQISFPSPLYYTQAPGDSVRAFVVSQTGIVWVLPNRSDAVSTTQFLNMASLVTDDGGEQGLLGLAFDPDFATNGFFYVNYNPNFDTSGSNPRRTQISQFQVTTNPNVVSLATEVPLLSYDQPYPNHKGGWLGFGPDDKLYIASGDGGSADDPDNNAQNLDVLLGKILRINPDGSIPSDNPFVGVAGRDEIWAYGLRNPFRASFDRVAGDLVAGDVGQGQREEIDVIEKGGNYGWRKFEGSLVHNAADPTPPSTIAPLSEYSHSNGRCSIIGGYLYRGSALPAHVGNYFYADYCSGELFELYRSGTALVSRVLFTLPGSPTSFGEDNAGELYVTVQEGKVYKLVPR